MYVGKLPAGSPEKWKEVFAGLIVDPSQVEIEKPLNEGELATTCRDSLLVSFLDRFLNYSSGLAQSFHAANFIAKSLRCGYETSSGCENEKWGEA